MTTREAYERAPDGETWPGTLKGLKTAISDCVMESSRYPDTDFTLSVIVNGMSTPIRVYRDGAQL